MRTALIATDALATGQMDGGSLRLHSRPMHPATIDTAMRLIAIGQLVLIALVVARSKAPRATRAATALLLLGVAGYLVNSGEFLRGGPALLWAPVALMANLAALFLW